MVGWLNDVLARVDPWKQCFTKDSQNFDPWVGAEDSKEGVRLVHDTDAHYDSCNITLIYITLVV